MKETVLKSSIFELWDMDADCEAPRAFHALMDYCGVSDALNTKFFDESQTKEIQKSRDYFNLVGEPSIELSEEDYLKECQLINPNFSEEQGTDSWILCYELMNDFDIVKGKIKNEEVKVPLKDGNFITHKFGFDEGAKPFQEFILEFYLNETYQNLGWKHDDSLQRMSQIDQLLQHPDEQ